MALLLFAAGSACASAQETEQIDGHLELLLTKKDKLDSLYNYWNEFVAGIPRTRRRGETSSRWRTAWWSGCTGRTGTRARNCAGN